VPTACTGCSITKVTSIAQPQGSENLNDGSFFGVNASSNPSIFWEDIRYGEWQAGSNSSSSTLVYSTNSNSWYAGEENYPNANAAYAQVDPTVYAFQSYDGVSLVSGAQVQSHKRAASAFNISAPPTCTADSHGYCVATTSTSGGEAPISVCDGGQAPYTLMTYTFYQIRNSRSVLTPYEKLVPKDCPNTVGWRPSNPAITLSDPNLP
jgi:hypothetical protein